MLSGNTITLSVASLEAKYRPEELRELKKIAEIIKEGDAQNIKLLTFQMTPEQKFRIYEYMKQCELIDVYLKFMTNHGEYPKMDLNHDLIEPLTFGYNRFSNPVDTNLANASTDINISVNFQSEPKEKTGVNIVLFKK